VRRHPVLQSYEYDRVRLLYITNVQRRRRGETFDRAEALRLEQLVERLARDGYAILEHSGAHYPRPGGPKP
jgi:hypothetical protein